MDVLSDLDHRKTNIGQFSADLFAPLMLSTNMFLSSLISVFIMETKGFFKGRYNFGCYKITKSLNYYPKSNLM